jgi:WD40 repeat protein
MRMGFATLCAGGVAHIPGNRFVVSASQDKTMKVWELDTHRELFDLKGHTGPFMAWR